MVRYLGMFSSASLLVGLVVLAGSGRSRAQDEVPNSYPHDYPGKPSGDFSPEWQECVCMSLLLLIPALINQHFRLPCERFVAERYLPFESFLGREYPSKQDEPSERYTLLLGI